MKRFVKMGFTSICLAALAASSCTWDETDVAGSASLTFNVISSKAAVTDPDEFTLTVISADGDSCFCGRFADRPQSLSVKPGLYEVSLKSEFDGPAFDSPQYGDVVNVSVKKKETANIELYCRLVNSGMSLAFSDNYRREYGMTPLVLSQAGREVEYPVTENGIAYFNPGKVFLSHNGEVILYKELERGQIKHLNLDAVYSSASVGFTVHVDTEAQVDEEFQIVEPEPFSIDEAMEIDNGLTASVCGYIAGAVKNSKFKAGNDPDCDVTSNIVIVKDLKEASLSNGMPVELKGAFKSELNIPGNPALVGRKIIVKGVLAPYFGVKGLKSISKYKLQ